MGACRTGQIPTASLCQGYGLLRSKEIKMRVNPLMPAHIPYYNLY